MLVDVTPRQLSGFETALVSVIGGGAPIERVDRGLYIIGHWNFEMYLPNEETWETYSSVTVGDDFYSSYGVCDSPAQFMEKLGPALEATPHKYVVSFVLISKDDQPNDGGWRWHKWGEYIGTQTPTTEYLYDEPLIREVYTYHFYVQKSHDAWAKILEDD